MYVYVHVRPHTYMYAYIHACINTYIHTYINLCICLCTYIHISFLSSESYIRTCTNAYNERGHHNRCRRHARQRNVVHGSALRHPYTLAVRRHVHILQRLSLMCSGRQRSLLHCQCRCHCYGHGKIGASTCQTLFLCPRLAGNSHT
jgi:hypothetical protein